MLNSSLNKSKSNKLGSLESSPNNTKNESQYMKNDPQFQNRNVSSITRSAKRKATPGWGPKSSIKNTGNMTQLSIGRSSNNRKSPIKEDLLTSSHWENKDFILNDDKNG